MTRRLIAGTALALIFGVAAQAQDGPINITTYGGAFGAAVNEAFVKPFTAETGVQATMVDNDNPPATLKAQVEAGNITSDVFDVEQSDVLRLCDEGLIEPIDPSILPAAADGTPAEDDYLPQALHECATAIMVWSTVIAYNTEAFPDGAPTTVADFFDTEKFPGKRALPNYPTYTLPIALKGSDVIGQARTGMGKTLGFGIPVLDRVFDDATVTAPDGTPLLAAADGTVTVAEFSGGYGGLIVIEHTIDGSTVATAYIHSWADGIHVTVGDQVSAGQHIADVGSSGMSTGPHLHFEVREGGTDGDHVDPAAWLNSHDAADLPEAETGPPDGDEGCATEDGATPGGEPDPIEGDPSRMVDDPTSDGQITARLLHLHDQTLGRYPQTSWACWSPRPGQSSEHPLGRACDIAFGNAIGQYPTPSQLEAGWEVTNWMKDNAEALGVEYLIWQGQIWSLSRDDEGWRDYGGGGMHDPDNVTGGHFDHLHVTVAE